jgi:SET domain-containing protein 6
LLPLQGGEEGNPGDVVEIRADLVVDAVSGSSNKTAWCKDRIDWWLEEGGDESIPTIPIFCFHTLTISWDSTFAFESDLEPPDPLLSFIRLLMLPQDEWEKIEKKGIPPKPKTDAVALGIVCDVLAKRLNLYSTTIQVCDL